MPSPSQHSTVSQREPLPLDQLLHAFQAVGFLGWLVPADAVDAREAQGDAGLVAGGALHGVEGHLEAEAGPDRPPRAAALGGGCADPAVDPHALFVGEAEVGLAARPPPPRT